MRYICSIKLKQQILTTMATITINTTTRREANEIIREIQYNDMFDEIKYQYNIHIRFKARLNKSDLEELASEFLAVRVTYFIDQILPKRFASFVSSNLFR